VAGETDPVIKQFREQISDNDLKIVEAINKRLKLVAQLKRYKEEHRLEFYDPDREQWMLTFVSRANKGPLSREALEELYAHLLAVTKSELGGEPAATGGAAEPTQTQG
jgi:chorismate mutase/prephenate dehydratase